MMGDNRGSGRTTRQLLRMRDKGLFITASGEVDYVWKLCKYLGGQVNVRNRMWFRTDGSIVRIHGPEMLNGIHYEKLYGLIISHIVVDHAAKLNDTQCENLEKLKYATRCL